MDKKTLRLAFCGLFAALTVIATLISINVGGQAYLNCGDAVIHVCAYVVGGLPAALAAAVGSCLADLILGSALYAPATFVIKGLMALTGALLFKTFNGKKNIAAILIAGLIMPIGYLVYELFLYEPMVAFSNALLNLIQYGFGCIVGYLLIEFSDKLKLKDTLSR